ncbi:MAG: hypothetical protein EA380_10925 [Phycisphaeraceae bacterium]|nr:MAG: hypothetical protein EA380_10925 [Phycisphaeraceae bacterium]
MEDTESQVRVNFTRPFPLFPLDGVVLLPHAMLRLFLFEPRYRQMMEHVLDGAGQIAMAVFDGRHGSHEGMVLPRLKPAVCIGQLVQHERNPDGTYHCWLQGVCRAQIVEEHAPAGDRLYREATLQPISRPDEVAPGVPERHARLVELLRDGPLRDTAPVARLIDQLDEQAGDLDAIAPNVLLEVVALGLINTLDRPHLMYRLLEEPDEAARYDLALRELSDFSSLLRTVQPQFDPEAPQGISWN